MNAKQLIAQAEQAAKLHQRRTNCDDATRSEYELCTLQGMLADACEELAAATNPSDCHDVTIDGITYGMQWDKGDECWLAYIGGQVVNVALSSELIDKLCDEAERIALDGEAA